MYHFIIKKGFFYFLPFYFSLCEKTLHPISKIQIIDTIIYGVVYLI